MEDGQEVKPLREVPKPYEHCGKPMRRVIVGTMTRQPRYMHVCQQCEQQTLGELVEP